MEHRGQLIAAGALGVLAAGLTLGDHWAKRRYGRPPRRLPKATEVPLDAVDVEVVPADGPTLRGWLRRPPEPLSGERPQAGPAALVVHGWGGSAFDMFPLSEPLRDAGLQVLLLDARGHGRSDDAEVSSMPAFAEDIRQALAWLRSLPDVDPARVVLVGHSVGAGACLFVAASDPTIAAVVSLASMADPHELMSGQLRRRLPRALTAVVLRYIEHTIGHRFTEFAPIHTIGRAHAPVLLLHGQHDTTVPVSDAYRLHARAPRSSTLVVLPDADHNSVEALAGATPTLLGFLRDAGLLATRGED